MGLARWLVRKCLILCLHLCCKDEALEVTHFHRKGTKEMDVMILDIAATSTIRHPSLLKHDYVVLGTTKKK